MYRFKTKDIVNSIEQDFEQLVISKIIDPINELLKQFESEGAYDEHVYSSGVVSMMTNPADQTQVITAVIELSRCAFLGFIYSPENQERINHILDDSILIAHTMSADIDPQ